MCFRYGEINKLVLKRNGDECLDYKYYKNVDMMKNVSWDGVKASTGGKIPKTVVTYDFITVYTFLRPEQNHK